MGPVLDRQMIGTSRPLLFQPRVRRFRLGVEHHSRILLGYLVRQLHKSAARRPGSAGRARDRPPPPPRRAAAPTLKSPLIFARWSTTVGSLVPTGVLLQLAQLSARIQRDRPRTSAGAEVHGAVRGCPRRPSATPSRGRRPSPPCPTGLGSLSNPPRVIDEAGDRSPRPAASSPAHFHARVARWHSRKPRRVAVSSAPRGGSDAPCSSTWSCAVSLRRRPPRAERPQSPKLRCPTRLRKKEEWIVPVTRLPDAEPPQ